MRENLCMILMPQQPTYVTHTTANLIKFVFRLELRTNNEEELIHKFKINRGV